MFGQLGVWAGLAAENTDLLFENIKKVRSELKGVTSGTAVYLLKRVLFLSVDQRCESESKHMALARRLSQTGPTRGGKTHDAGPPAVPAEGL